MSTPLSSGPAAAGPAGLNAEEWRLVCALRDVPGGALRTDLLTMLDRLLAFGRNPHCSRMQADGVPCTDVAAACAECSRVESWLGRLRAALPCI